MQTYSKNYIVSSGGESDYVKGGGIAISAVNRHHCDPICLDIELKIRGTSNKWNTYAIVALERWFHLTVIWNKQQLRFYTDDAIRAVAFPIHYDVSEKAGSPRGMFVGSSKSHGEFSIDELYYWDKLLGSRFQQYDYVRSAYYKVGLPGTARLSINLTFNEISCTHNKLSLRSIIKYNFNCHKSVNAGVRECWTCNQMAWVLFPLGVTFFSKFYNPDLHNIARSDSLGLKM